VTLGTIDIGNQKAIDSLVKLLERDDLETWFRYNVAEALGTIDIGNQKAIDSLVKLLEWVKLSEDDMDFTFQSQIAEALGKIGVGNQQAIDSLVKLLAQEDLESLHYLNVADTLEKIATKQKKSLVIWLLKNYTTDEVYQSNFEQFRFCHQVIFHCAQTLSYPEFHTAWHQTHLPTSPFSPKPFTNN
jgi:HEAT repeat protein